MWDRLYMSTSQTKVRWQQEGQDKFQLRSFPAFTDHCQIPHFYTSHWSIWDSSSQNWDRRRVQNCQYNLCTGSPRCSRHIQEDIWGSSFFIHLKSIRHRKWSLHHLVPAYSLMSGLQSVNHCWCSLSSKCSKSTNPSHLDQGYLLP